MWLPMAVDTLSEVIVLEIVGGFLIPRGCRDQVWEGAGYKMLVGQKVGSTWDITTLNGGPSFSPSALPRFRVHDCGEKVLLAEVSRVS